MKDISVPYELLEEIAEESGQLWLIANEEGKVIWCTASFTLKTGYKIEEIRGQKIGDFLKGPSDTQAIQSALQSHVEKSQAFEQEVLFFTKSGDDLLVYLTGKPIYDKEGDFNYYLFSLRVISESKAENDIADSWFMGSENKAASLEFFKRAINASSLVSATNRQGTITYVNDRFAQVSGYTKEELLGENHRIINSNLHSHEFWKEMWKTIGNGKVWRKEIRNKRKDGTYYWVDTFIIPYTDEKGRVKEYLSIRNLITQRKRNEEALKKALSERELLIKELHHRVKNNLQLILSMLFLQELKESEGKAYYILKGLQSRIKTMALLHESFFESESIWELSAKSYIRKLVEQITGMSPYANAPLSIETKVEDAPIDVEKLIVLGLLLNELLTNSMRHAFKNQEQGSIYVLFQEVEQGTFRLVYKDNGAGLDMKAKEATDPNAFLMEKMLCEQLGAKFKVFTEPGQGLRASIKFSVA